MAADRCFFTPWSSWATCICLKADKLTIEYKDGTCAQYAKLGLPWWEMLVLSVSKGAFINQQLRLRHACQRVNSPCKDILQAESPAIN